MSQTVRGIRSGNPISCTPFRLLFLSSFFFLPFLLIFPLKPPCPMHSRTKTWKVRNIEMTRLTLSFFLRSLFNAIPRSSLPRLGIMQIPLVSFLFFFLLFHFFARAESSEEGAGGVCAAETWAYDKKKKVEGASLFQTLSRRKMNLNLVWRQTQPSSFSLLTLVFFFPF